jgi:DNA-binding transcriptional LysR family regulator
MKRIPNKVTPAFLSKNPLILVNVNSALRRMVTGWLGAAGTSAKPLMEFDNVEAIKSVVAVGLGASIVPSLALGEGHVTARNTIVLPLRPRAARKVGLVKLRGKLATDGIALVTEALLTLRAH